MAKTRVAIACQGGGSQTAFTAGALKALCELNLSDEIEIVAVSGTSGGAVCAALVWYSYMRGDRPIWGRLIDFWKDNTAQNWAEQAFNRAVVGSMRLVDSGLLPAFQISPSAPWMQAMMRFATIGQRPSFTDFPALLRTYIDFDEVAAWGARAGRPVLVVGAANVNSGKLAKFVSSREPIQLAHILASCAVPTIFPAVQIGGEAYWDGLFSDNPPIEELLRAGSVGMTNIPEEIWIIKINQTERREVPVQAIDIIDRRNQLEGNISLFHQLNQLETLNDMLLAGAFRPDFLAQLDIKAPIRIPKAFSSDADKPYHIPWIEMSAELHGEMSYEGKIDRSARNIDRLLDEGERSARRFLAERAARFSGMTSGEPAATARPAEKPSPPS
jgi:NTE family protein